MLSESFLGCALFIPRGCRIYPHLALMVPTVGLNWPPGMNRSLYLTTMCSPGPVAACNMFVGKN